MSCVGVDFVPSYFGLQTDYKPAIQLLVNIQVQNGKVNSLT